MVGFMSWQSTWKKRDLPLSEAPAAMGLQGFWIAALFSAGYLLTKTRNRPRAAGEAGGRRP